MEKLKIELILELVLKARETTTSKSEGLSGHLVDVGCGNGSLTKILAKQFERTTGIDVSPEQVMRAKEISSDPRIEYLVGKGEILPVESGSADAITAIFSAHSVDVNQLTSECLRVLKPGGIAVFWADTWSTVCSVDGNLTSQPDASHFVEDMNRELVEITREHSHPDFYTMDCYKTLFNEIKVTENKSLLSGRFEMVISLAEMKKYVLSMPFYHSLGDENPIHTFSKKLKELWKMESVPDEDIEIRASRKTYPIVIRN